tara:strand:+ start:1165 stop:1551 length:387 start_codon:yes stop_codon:yes gene_type:complete
MLTYALWFFFGALLHKFLALALRLGHNLIIFEKTTDSILSILDAVSRDVEKASEIKRRFLRDTDIPDKIINNIEETDKKLLNEWKSVIISKMIACTPRSYYKYIKYTSWDEAMPRVEKLRAVRGEDQK